jgi:integrase
MAKRSDESPARDNDGLHKRRGIWYYCLTINSERRFFSTKTHNFQEARRIKAKAVRDQEEGRLPSDLSKLPFEKLLAKVVEDRKIDLSENSIRIDRERSGPLLKFFSGRRVSTIDAAAIRAYQVERSKQVGNRTVNLETKLLRTVLKAAKIWATIADSYKPLKEDRTGPGRALEEAQEKLLFDVARSKPGWDVAFYAALAASNTTMRGCELKGLRLENVNLLVPEVSIQKSKGNTAGVRRIPLHPTAVWAFARLLERANALGSIEPEHFLFPAFRFRTTKSPNHGTGFDPTKPQKTWRTAWRALVKETARRAGEPFADETERKRAMAPFIGLRFHDLRHLAVTKLAESEASDATIQAIAGHMSREMMKHYSHVRSAAKRKAIDSMRSYNPEEKPLETTESVQ